MEVCSLCGKKAARLCPDLACEDCHKSLSFDDCCDGTWNVEKLLSNGRDPKDLRPLYPSAKQWKDLRT